MKNTFYHYTAKHLIPGIKKEGLTKGVTPIRTQKQGIDRLSFLTSTQWLTISRDPREQDWAIGVSTPYSRNEARIKINIPNPYMKNVVAFDAFCKMCKDYLWPDFDYDKQITKDWYVFLGNIPKQWIERVRIY